MTLKTSGVEHPLLMAGFGVIVGIYRVYAAEFDSAVLLEFRR